MIPTHSERTTGLASRAMRELLILMFLVTSAPSAMAQANLAREQVNPFIGTGGHGHTFPGACVPNGMVQLSPDTRPDGYMDWDGCGGYHYSDSVIYGFSHTHLSGTGVADLCDVLIMPVRSANSTAPSSYRSGFSHRTERANAGYYGVHLDDPDVDVELTSTARVGVHRYAFAKGMRPKLVVDLRHRDALYAANMVLVGDTELVGERRSSSWAKDQRLYFCIRFDRPVISGVTGAESSITTVKTVTMNEAGTVAQAFTFADNGRPLIVKVGISAVSIEGARANLEAEVPHWDFDLVRKQAEAVWNDKLGKINVEGGTREQQRSFYSALYHTYVAPYVFNDVDGQYRGMDGLVHKADHNVYTVFSLWDTFRALHPLMTVLEPEMTSDWIKTFLLHYQQGGRLPVWELWGNETDCMIGYHSVSVIADAYAKGIRDFDTKLALEAMLASANADHFGLKAYRERGYISSEDEPESVSRTLEYAYDDWCIARFADMTGNTEVAARFFTRGRNWQNLFDPATGFFRARRNGGFIDPFDPYEVNFHFTEANAWQYGLFVPHDMDHYLNLIGGRAALTQRLDALFTANEKMTGRAQSDITGLIGQYAHGNEPSHNFAYLYAQSDRPLSTDVYLNRIMQRLYTDAPDGLSGNEDCGQMSAWFVWSAMGLYPVTPGSPEYTIGIPLFDKVRVSVGGGKELVISTNVAGSDRAHVEGVQWRGKDTEPFRTLDHAQLLEGGTLHFELGPRPGSAPSPSLPAENVRSMVVPAPIISASSVTFVDSVVVRVSAIEGRWKIVLGTEYVASDNGKDVPEVRGTTVVLRRSGTVTAHCETADGKKGPVVTARFMQMDGDRTIALETSYANQYAAGGPQALVDGIRGGTDFRNGEWQGFEGKDVLATIDLGKVMKVKRLGIGALQDQKSWIWLPSEVEVVTSVNMRQWSSQTITHDVDPKREGSFNYDLWTSLLNKRVRYIKLIVRNAGPCPEWHPGKGGTSWIFMDEVLVEKE